MVRFLCFSHKTRTVSLSFHRMVINKTERKVRILEQKPREETYPTLRYGALVIAVTTARGAFPIAGASVTVSGNEAQNSDISFSLITDRSGKTEKIFLPAPPANLSQSPGDDKVSSVYSVTVNADGFYNYKSERVPVFAGVTSIQPVDLVPFSAYEQEKNEPKRETNTSNGGLV